MGKIHDDLPSCVQPRFPMISPRFRDVNPHDIRHSHLDIGALHHQWEFQDPKLEVPTIYKAYIRPM